MKWEVLAGLRFLLAWIVLCDHLQHFVPQSDFLARFSEFSGFAAVLGFLLVSGYSIAHSISKKTAGFYQRRLLRIYPLYLTAIIISLLPFLLVGTKIFSFDATEYTQPTLPNFVGNLFFLQGIFFYPLGSNGVIWTLSVEFFCYLLAPLLFKLNARIMLILIGISAICYTLYPHLHLPWGNDIAFLRYGLPLLLLFWAWLLGFFYFFHARNIITTVFLVGVGPLLMVINNHVVGHWAALTYSLSALGLVYGASISLPKWVQQLLNYLGELSYPLYLFHTPALLIGYAVLKFHDSAALACAALLTSAFFYHTVDIPIRHRKQRQLQPR